MHTLAGRTVVLGCLLAGCGVTEDPAAAEEGVDAITVREGDRDLNVLSACSLLLSPYLHFTPPERYPGVRADVEHTYQVLRSLPVDIWVTSHARLWGRYRKFQARATAADSVAPFIDPDGYRAYVDSGEARYRRLLAEQEGGS